MQAQLKDADPQMAAQQLESWKAYKKGFQEGIALFNQKPKKGVAFLQVSHSPSAQRIATSYTTCGILAPNNQTIIITQMRFHTMSRHKYIRLLS